MGSSLLLWRTLCVATRRPLRVAFFTLCVIALLCPTPLLEPRYFILPITLLGVECATLRVSWRTSGAWCACVALCAGAPLWVFVARPFRDSTGHTHRFMW